MQQIESGGNSSTVQKVFGDKVNRPIKANRKMWWNEENIFSWIKHPLTGWTVIANEPGPFRKGKSSKDDLPMKVDSVSTLSSQFLDGSYVKVRKCYSDEELSLVRENATESDLKKPKHEHSPHKALRRVQSRFALRDQNCDPAPLPSPESLTNKGEVDLCASSAGCLRETVGLGISGIKVSEYPKPKTVENPQASVEERLVDRPPCLPEIFVDVSLSEGESTNWSSQSSPANESVVSTTFSLLNYPSEEGTASEKQDRVEIIKSSAPTSISSCESVRSLIQPFLNGDQCMTTLPSPVNGDFSFIPARFSIDGSKFVFKDFVGHVLPLTSVTSFVAINLSFARISFLTSS